VLPKGLAPSSDPVLLARPAPYAISLGRRLGEPRP
jgi:catalase